MLEFKSNAESSHRATLYMFSTTMPANMFLLAIPDLNVTEADHVRYRRYC